MNYRIRVEKCVNGWYLLAGPDEGVAMASLYTEPVAKVISTDLVSGMAMMAGLIEAHAARPSAQAPVNRADMMNGATTNTEDAGKEAGIRHAIPQRR